MVTGSLLPVTELVTAAPVDQLTAADIQNTSAQDLLQLIKRLNPGFSGNANVGQTVNNGGFGEAYVALRNLPTLVLLNGRRLGNSSFSNGSLVDVNTIPLSMIERIEILKDGASALYGSAAVGGVINIITKKEYDGAEVSGRWGFTTRGDDYTEERASAVMGTANDKGWLIGGGQFFRSDPLLSRDRKIASMGLDELQARGQAFASYMSPSFPGRVQARTGNAKSYLLAGSPFLKGQPGYNPAITTPPIVPGGPFSGPTAVDDYNAAAIAAGYVDPTGNGLGPYVPIGADGAPLPTLTLLNTTLFGTHSIQSQDRKQFFLAGERNLIDKHVQLFGQFLFANTKSVGALAPSPVISLFDANIFIPSNNVHNPFGIDLGPVGGAATPRIRSRFIQSGNRIFDNQSDFFHVTAGLKGEFEEGWSYNLAYTFNQSDQTAFTRNAINGAALELALRPNPDPALAALGLSALMGRSGFVPQYNFFFTPTEDFPTRQGPNAPETIEAIKTTLFQSGRSEEWNADGVVTGEPLDLPAGKLGLAVGGNVRSEALFIDFDGLTQLGKVPGLNMALPTSGRRDSYAFFGEVRIPLTSPEMELPALRSLEVIAAGRFESYDPGGDRAVPKVSLRYQPIDEQILLRGSYSESFVAPTVFQLFGGDAANFPVLTVADGTAQLQTINISNPGLEPVDARNYTAGIVISPKAIPGLSLSVDYYNVKVKNDIFRLSEQAMVDDLNANGSASRFAPFFRFDDGSQLTTPAPNQITLANFGTLRVPLENGATTETDGLDLAMQYRRDIDEFGTLTVYTAANVIFDFLFSDPVIGGPFHYEGQYTDRVNGIGGGQGLLPDYQITTGLTWEYKNLTYTINARYIPKVDDLGDLHPAVGSDENFFTVDGKKWVVDSWFAIDMQIAYEFGKTKTQKAWYDGFRVAIGALNITDEDPPQIASSFEDNTDKSSYDILGRFIYFEASKKF